MSTISKALPKPPDNFSTTLTGSLANNGLSFTVNAVTNAAGTQLPSEGVGVLFKKLSDGSVDPETVEFMHWTGVNSGTKTISVTDTGDRGISGSYNGAQAYAAGDYFEVWVSSEYQFYDWMNVEHNADGTHDSTLVAMLAGAQTFTGAKTFSTAPLLTFGSEANGDTYYSNGSGELQRLPIGTTGQVLAVSGGIPAWGGQVKSMITSFGSGTYSSGGTNFAFPCDIGNPNTTETLRQLLLPAATLKEIRFNITLNTLNNNLIVTVRKNAADTTLTKTVSATTTGAQVTTTDVSVSANDLISIKLDTSAAGSGSATISSMVLVYQIT